MLSSWFFGRVLLHRSCRCTSGGGDAQYCVHHGRRSRQRRPRQRNGKFLKEKGYYTTLIGDDAVKLIDQQDGNTPFFLYFASLAPHAPYQVDLYPTIKDKNRRGYAGMISALDDDVGRILAALEKKKLPDNTIILFPSDNGGATSALFATGARSEEERKESGGVGLGEKPPASNAPFRGGKGSLYEGGVRVPRLSVGPDICDHASSTSRCTWSM